MLNKTVKEAIDGTYALWKGVNAVRGNPGLPREIAPGGDRERSDVADARRQKARGPSKQRSSSRPSKGNSKGRGRGKSRRRGRRRRPGPWTRRRRCHRKTARPTSSSAISRPAAGASMARLLAIVIDQEYLWL